MEPPSPYAEQRYKDGLECARRATQFDQAGQYSAALSLYGEAIDALNQACALAPLFSPIQPRVVDYTKRALQLSSYLESTTQGRNFFACDRIYYLNYISASSIKCLWALALYIVIYTPSVAQASPGLHAQTIQSTSTQSDKNKVT